MSWLRRMRTLDTACSVQATGKLFNLPWAASKDPTHTEVYDKSQRLAEVKWDRIVLFNGKCGLPPVTVKPRFEFWNYVKLKSDSEPELKLLIHPKISAIFRTKNLALGGAALLAVVGIGWYLYRQQRKRFEANVANTVAASVHSALVEALQNVTVKEAIGQAARDAVTPVHTSIAASVAVSLQDIVSQAVEGAVDQVHEAFQGAVDQVHEAFQGAVDQVHEAFQGAVYEQDILGALENAVQADIGQTSIVTVGEVTEGHLDSTGEEQETNLGTFLQTLGAIVSEPTIQSGAVKIGDLHTSSVQQLVRRGILEEDAVKMKQAVSYLLGHRLI